MKSRIFLIILLIICLSHQIAGKIEKKIDVTHVGINYKEDSTIKIDLVMTKFNRTHSAITANGTLTDVIDDKYRFELELRVWKDGGWKRNYVRYGNKDPCNSLKYTIGKTWNDIMMEAKVNYKCPYYPGEYGLSDYYISVDKVPVLFGSGLFKLIIHVFKEMQFVIELDVDLAIKDVA